MAYDEGDIIQHLFTVNGFAYAFHSENLVTDFPLRTKINVRIFTAGGANLIQLYFFQGTFSGGSLLGFGSIGREAGDKLLQFLDCFFLLFVGFLHLLDQQLAGLIPEVIVTGIKLDFTIINISGMRTYFI